MGAQRYRANDLIVRQGDYGDACYIVVEGKIQIEEQDISGESQILSFLDEGDFFGESALMEHTPRMASVRAIEEVTVLKLYRDDFERFSEASPDTVQRIMERLISFRTLLSITLFADLPAGLRFAPRHRTTRVTEMRMASGMRATIVRPFRTPPRSSGR